MDARAKARKGDASAEIDVALIEGDLDLLAFDEIQKRLEGKKLSDAQTTLLKDVELSAMIAAVANAGRDEAAAKPAAKKLADAYAAGRVPASKGRQQRFYFIVFQYALSEGGDPDLAQTAFDAVKPLLKEMAGDDPGLDAWIKKQQDAIDEFRAKKEGGAGGDEGVEEGCGEGAK